jgi:hypothetical protein
MTSSPCPRGFDADTAVDGPTAFSLLQVSGQVARPILALPDILADNHASWPSWPPSLTDRFRLAPLLAGPPSYLLFRLRYGR